MDRYEIKRCYKQDGSGRDAAFEGYRQVLAENPDGMPRDLAQKLITLAADYAHPEALMLMLEAGADTAIDNSMGFTLFHVLARREDSHYCKKPEGAVRECVDILLDRQVSVLKKDLDGLTCYHYAARLGIHEFIEALAVRGQKLNTTDRQGNTGIHIAAKEASHAVYDVTRAKEKIEKAKAEYRKIYDRQKGYGKSEEEISKYMANVMSGLTPDADKECADLIEAEALLERYFLTIKAFRESGVDQYDKNNSDHTALDYAVEAGAKKISAYLSDTLIEGNQDAVAAGGMTLHQAAEKGDTEAINALARTGTDLNALKDGDNYPFGGCTALAIACSYLQHGAVEALLTNGADPSLKDGTGRSAVSYMVVDPKASAGSRVFDGKLIFKMINDMISAGFGIDETINDDGDTLLISACKSRYGTGYNNRSIKGDIMDAVLALSPAINLTNRFGETALMHTCARDFDRMEPIQIALLERGADVASADQNGDTALHYAAQNQDKNGAKSLCDMLLEFGADLNAVNNAGQTALDIAVALNNEQLVKLLLGKL